jgi:hypothetical protein
MTIQEELALRIQFEKQHNPRLTDAEAQTAAMQDRDFARRYREAQWTHAAHTPVRKQARVTYEQALEEVDGLVKKQAGSTRPDAWATVLQAHQGKPDQKDYEEAYRKCVLYQQPDDMAQALVEENPLQPLSAEDIWKRVKAMPGPAPQPWTPFWFTR